MKSSQEDATFTVRVTGGKAPYTYTWYVLKDNDEYIESYKTSSGKNTLTYNFSDYDFEGYQTIVVNCVITDASGQRIASDYTYPIPKL